jgi:hypothetical protein
MIFNFPSDLADNRPTKVMESALFELDRVISTTGCCGWLLMCQAFVGWNLLFKKRFDGSSTGINFTEIFPPHSCRSLHVFYYRKNGALCSTLCCRYLCSLFFPLWTTDHPLVPLYFFVYWKNIYLCLIATASSSNQQQQVHVFSMFDSLWRQIKDPKVCSSSSSHVTIVARCLWCILFVVLKMTNVIVEWSASNTFANNKKKRSWIRLRRESDFRSSQLRVPRITVIFYTE